jgi:hypothetical protein
MRWILPPPMHQLSIASPEQRTEIAEVMLHKEVVEISVGHAAHRAVKSVSVLSLIRK